EMPAHPSSTWLSSTLDTASKPVFGRPKRGKMGATETEAIGSTSLTILAVRDVAAVTGPGSHATSALNCIPRENDARRGFANFHGVAANASVRARDRELLPIFHGVDVVAPARGNGTLGFRVWQPTGNAPPRVRRSLAAVEHPQKQGLVCLQEQRGAGAQDRR